MKQSSNLKLKRRIKVELIIFILGFIVINAKLVYVQLIKGSEYLALATEQLNASRTINANRGTIYDSNRRDFGSK